MLEHQRQRATDALRLCTSTCLSMTPWVRVRVRASLTLTRTLTLTLTLPLPLTLQRELLWQLPPAIVATFNCLFPVRVRVWG